jgi:hypothetical protein
VDLAKDVARMLLEMAALAAIMAAIVLLAFAVAP